AEEALGRRDQAVHDYTKALERQPRLAPAALNRGIVYYQLGRPAEAYADLRRALEIGADPAAVPYNPAPLGRAPPAPAAPAPPAATAPPPCPACSAPWSTTRTTRRPSTSVTSSSANADAVSSRLPGSTKYVSLR